MTSLCESYESNIFKLLPTFAVAAVGGCAVPCTAAVVVVVPFVSTIDPLYRKLAPR